jgi:hypothetical protein
MNIVQLQDQLKNFSQDQLVREMQMPSGSAPQFLVLGEIMRRQKMQQDFTAQQAKGDQGTVAQEAIAAAGVPQGGIADMARAMAPSTDMAQNTGVQAMYAGGPVKKMAEGDKVVRGGRVYIEQEDGTYLREDGGARILTPGQALSRDVEALTNIDVGGGLRNVFQPVGDTLRGIFQPVGETARETLQPVGDTMRETLQPVGQDLQTLFDPRQAEPAVPTSEFSAEDINAAIEAAAAKDRTARTMRAIQAERAPEGPKSARQLAFEEAQAQDTPNILAGMVDPVMTGLGDIARGISGETVADYEARKAAAAAAAETPMPSRADRDQQGIAAIPTEAEVVEAEKIAAEEKAAADAAAAAEQPTSQGGGAGGGIAGGAGSASSYEQALMDALSSREKAAEQDKWLALAQVGLNLMSSTQPTLGGALGEAGLKGVEAARGARDQYDKEKLEILGALEQSRLARAKAASAGAAKPKALPAGALDVYDAEITAIEDALSGLSGPVSPEQQMQLTAQRNALLSQKAALRNIFLSQYGIGSAGASPAAASGVYSMDDVSE